MTLKINEDRYRFVVGSREGPVGRYLGRVGARAESHAKAIATEEKLVRTGRYRASLSWRWAGLGSRLAIEVGSAVPHAKVLEHGTEPGHLIFPGAVTGRSKKKALWWTHGAERGWVVPERPLPYVIHPGNRAYNVIGRAIVLAIKGGIR